MYTLEELEVLFQKNLGAEIEKPGYSEKEYEDT